MNLRKPSLRWSEERKRRIILFGSGNFLNLELDHRFRFGTVQFRFSKDELLLIAAQPTTRHHIMISSINSLPESRRSLANGNGAREAKTTRPGDEVAPEQDGDGADVQLHSHEREEEGAGDDGNNIPGTRQGT
ncbi:hypothetical protein F5888DRAFT_1636793 [Russula emetica]|nr:hypothetical protein F5888DRAFT_1636793 [Russula emetica]